MANENLLDLLRVAEAMPSHLLHMSRFRNTEAPCGTAYCLAGFAGIDPVFQARGLMFADASGLVCQGVPSSGWTLASFINKLAEFFGITNSDARHLFALNTEHHVYATLDEDEHAITKEMVIAKLRQLIAGESIFPYFT